jgi:ATP-dependent exoDNAse (exonuclease V) beta subunit
MTTDEESREIIRGNLQETLVVEAAAGTGKTTELVRRMVAVLQAGHARVDQMVAVTFTEKAAGELKLRLRGALENARVAAVNPEARANLEHALAHLEEAHLSTIHGFCGDVLRARPVEAGVDPLFEVLTEPQSRALYGHAFESWLQEQLANPLEGVRRALQRQPRFQFGLERRSNRLRLRDAGWALVEWRDFTTAWKRPEFNRDAEGPPVIKLLHAFAEISENPSQPVTDKTFIESRGFRHHAAHLRALERAQALDADSAEATLTAVAGHRKVYTKGLSHYAPKVTRAQVGQAYEQLMERARRYAEGADADLAALLHTELQGSLQRYEEMKQRGGRVDFLDLLLKTRNLLRDSRAAREGFQRRFSHLFVDEFQDTDPMQAEILMLLASADPAESDWRKVTPTPGKLFVVGDPKQSIYRFRRADVGTYLEVKDLLVARGARLLNLRRSFRSVPNIQGFVNAAFSRHMTGDRATLQAGYVPLESDRANPTTQPSVVALPVPKPLGKYGKPFGVEIENSLPGAVAAWVQWLTEESGWMVTEPQAPGVPVKVEPKHVCLLFRRLSSMGSDVARPYVTALEARGVPHLLVGGRGFHAREEVETLRAALNAVEWPDDQLSVFAALKGPLFAITDDALLEFRHFHGSPHPFRIPTGPLPEALMPIRDALLLLQQLHRARNRCPVAETIHRLLDATRAHAGLVLRHSGEQALANVLHIADMARQYETQGGISFRGFVEQLQDDAEAGVTPEAPILEEGSDGVRIMTVHTAKGLEFPVVILADITAPLGFTRASRFHDGATGLCAMRLMDCAPVELLGHAVEEVARERSEGVRLAYVAATRARDVLVVPAIGDPGNNEECWVGPMYPALIPSENRRRQPWKTVGCPPFGLDTVMGRPEETGFSPLTVQPGLHPFKDHQVVWWDPSVLRLDVEPTYGLRREELLKEKTPGPLQRGLDVHQHWADARRNAQEAGSRPGMNVSTVTQFAQGLETVVTVPVEEVERPRDSARGKRYGTLVHAVLATVPLDGSADVVGDTVGLQGRILGASVHEVECARVVVNNALKHPLMRRALAAEQRGECRREAPVTLRQPGGDVLEGVIDLAFCEDNTWWVVDFKTDADPTVGMETYARQVTLYAQAVSVATGKPASALLLRL